MLFKVALCEVIPLQKIDEGANGLVKTASGNVVVAPGSEQAKIIEAEVEKHPTALFFRAKAIKADEMNSNGDYFTSEELIRSHKTFEGVPFFTNHDNQNVENARGKIVFAEWIPEEKAVYVIAFIDREAFPDICRSIEEDYIDGVSMGCAVEYSVCSICGNVAERTEDYCTHIRNRKGRKFSGKAKDVKTGEVKNFKDAEVFEYNYGIKFIELSAVVDPACPSCRIQGVIPNDDYICRVANIQNTLYMVKTAAIHKKASQEDIQQLNQCLATLEQLAVQLIQNRQQIEVEFASDLVNILSELQTFTDELVGAGYGNVQGAGIPGVTGAPDGETPAAAPTEGAPAGTAIPVSATTPIPNGGVGTVAGSPNKPLVQSPQLPITAPAKPMATDTQRFHKIAGLVGILNGKLGEDMAKRRTKSERIEQMKVATEVLSNSWQEKQDFLEYIKQVPSLQNNNCKLSVKKSDDTFIIVAENKENKISSNSKVWTYEDLNEEERRLIVETPHDAALYFLNTFANNLTQQKEGVNVMTENRKQAGANSVNKAPEVVQEAQLEGIRDLYHGRTGEEQQSITEKQLEGMRKGEPEVITEEQLNGSLKLHPRKNEGVEVVQEAQLKEDSTGASPRTNEVANEITQAQLDSNRTNTDPEVITENQLNNIAAPWERAANRNRSLFKSAGDHMQSVINVMADTVISTGCTPNEAASVAGSLVDSTKGRFELGNAILDASDAEDVDYSKRLAYWSKKNIRVAGVGTSDIADAIIGGLRKVASDTTINPEVIVDALDVLSEGQIGIDGISKRVDEKIAAAEASASVSTSKKNALRDVLKASVEDGKEARDEERKEIIASVDGEEKREDERKNWEGNLSQPDAKIVTDFDEIGIQREDPSFRQALSGFARGALASQNMKLAAITNVTINGETITIAVQTDEGEESVEIPVTDKLDTMVQEEEIVPEGDMAGEGLETNMAPTGMAPLASTSKKMKRKAQVPMGGGIPGTPGEVAGGSGSNAGVPDGTPGGEQGIQSLTTDEGMDSEVSDEIPTAGAQQPLGSVCPECGTTDVDITEENGDIHGVCQNPDCGAEYDAMVETNVKYKIVKTKGENGEEIPEAPEVPALPVAAQTRLDKGSIVRTAANQSKYGHVCPACGMNQCKASSEEAGSAVYTCPACNTEVSKDVIVNVNNPEEAYLRVAWDIVPNVKGCVGCGEHVAKFASLLRVEKMMKQASDGATEFPTANCKELIARIYGGNATATFGPCKGKVLAECVCGRLQSLGLRTVRHMEKMAAVSMQEDPMNECLKDQQKKGYAVKEAENICNCLKKKFASAIDDNIYMQAFAEDIKSGKEKILTAQDLSIISDILDREPEIEAEEYEDVDMSSAITGEDNVNIEISKGAAEELAEAATSAVSAEVEVEVIEGIPEMGSATEVEVSAGTKKEESTSKVEVSPKINTEKEKEIAMSMQTHKLRRVGEGVVKVAATPKEVKDIEGNVEAGVPRAKATMGNEGADNIDVPMAKPSVPRANAEMGHEGADNINPKAGLPNVAVDSSYMGDEKNVQKDMPPINNEIKGTVIAESDKVTKKAKQLKEVDTVEGDVEAGVPRAKATMGNEGADNIDVPMAKPSIPRGNAEMGNEGADNINPKATGPDVPVDNAYMGDEKNVQKGMPAISDEYLKQVQQEHRKEQQLERLSTARKQEAMKVAYKLMASKRIPEQAFDDVVEALSNFKIDEISVKAESMYPKRVVTAGVADVSVYAGPAIVMESKEMDNHSGDSFADRLASHFTIGNKSFDENLTRYGEK